MRCQRLCGLFLVLISLVVLPLGLSSVKASEEGVRGAAHAVQGQTVGHGDEVASHEAHGAGGHEGGHHVLTHGQVMNFVWHCLNFAILVVVLVKFLKAPIQNALKGRSEEIEKAFSDLEDKKKEAERKYAEYEKKLSQMDKEAERILKNFIEQGESEKEKIIAQAKESAERIKAQAELYVQQELEKAKKELQSEVADLAVQMAEDIIRKNLNEQDHHKLISEYLEKVVTKN